MYKRFNILTKCGLVVFHDASIVPPKHSRNEDEFRRELRSGGKDGKWFYLDAEDEVNCRIDVYIDQEPDGLPEHRFENLGGTFMLQLETGELIVSGFEQWSPDAVVDKLDVDAGAYALSVRGPGEFDPLEYKEEEKALIGEKEWRYRLRIDYLALVCYLCSFAVVISLVIAPLRQYWYIALSLLILVWSPYFLLTKSKRYRRIESQLKEYEESLAHYVVHLGLLDSGVRLTGGHLDIK